MSDHDKEILAIIEKALSGKGAHVATRTIFDGLDWKTAGALPAGAPHSIYQMLWHLNFWQDWAIKWLEGGNPKIPKHAVGSWPGKPSPANAKQWQGAVKHFRAGLQRMAGQAKKGDLFAARGGHTRLGMLHAIASHNSHHAGQVVTLRQMLGKWPPPSGGVTW